MSEQITFPRGTQLDEEYMLRCHLIVEIEPAPSRNHHGEMSGFVAWRALTRIGSADGYHACVYAVSQTRDHAIDSLKRRIVAALVESEEGVRAQEQARAVLATVVARWAMP